MKNGPRMAYSGRLEERRLALAALEERHRKLGNLRLAVAGVEVVLVWLALVRGAISAWWLLLPVAVFIALAVKHDGVLRARDRARRAVAFYEAALERLAGRLAGETGAGYAARYHPYAVDLDLFGEGSIFQLLSRARTHIGEDTLSRWLLTPAGRETVAERQQAVQELTPMLDLREDLAVLAEEARTGVDPAALAAWGEGSPLLHRPRILILLRVLSTLGQVALLGFLYSLATHGSPLWRDALLVIVVVNCLCLLRLHRKVAAVVEAVEHAAHDLALLTEVICRIEREKFTSPYLRALRASLDQEGEPPSASLRRLRWLRDFLDSRDHVLVRALEPVNLFTPRLAYRVEAWRRRSGPAVRRWLEAVGDFEALSSLACHAYEHPADVFPELLSGAPRFEAHDLAHPLLAEDRAVRNRVTLGGDAPHLLVVSGSNMSGKSTLLRAVGVNIVLALAGAPVRATRLSMTPLMVGASIRVLDSLQSGTSRFYAEIVRLREIVDLTRGAIPVLFLLDEFLHGTNSHDRRVGAEAIARGLVERGSIGLLTTHDLALAAIAESLGSRAANVHFEDHLEDGRMTFDYRLRPGVVHKSNALELMRSVGLEV